MISSDRFIVSRSENYQKWVDHRLKGVSATTIATATTPSGFNYVTHHWKDRYSIHNGYTDFGNRSEEPILNHLQEWVNPNDWLIAASSNKYHFATPDGLSNDHKTIAEVKTTGKPWEGVAEGKRLLPIQYRRQIQWQLHCTGAEKCVVAWMLRVPDGHGWYEFGWDEPKILWIEKDETMLKGLLETATRLEETLLAEWDEENIPW